MLEADAVQANNWRGRRNELGRVEPDRRAELLAAESRRRRRVNLETIARAGQGHVGGDMSITDVLTVLFDYVLDIDPLNPEREQRDRLVLSKGHCAGALYTALAACGFMAPSELSTFMAPTSALNGHPNRLKVPGVEANTGPLGHGLPIGVGIAQAGRLRGSSFRTFVLLGDGELQEGSNWEAFMSAAHYGLAGLFAVVDRNRLQQGARTEDTNALNPLEDRLQAFGWEIRSVDGHDYTELIDAFEPSRTGKPVAVIANTVKGKGISFMEDDVAWHHKVPTTDQVAAALEDLV